MTKQDIDLQKIQVLESSYQGWFNLNVSLVITAFVALAIFIGTLEAEGNIDFNFFLGLDVGAFFFIGFGLFYIGRMHKEHLKFIGNLISQIEKGERLGSIEELEFGKKHKGKKAQR